MDGGNKTLKERREEEIREEEIKKLPTIRETENSILQVVKGQDEQVRSIVTAAYRSVMLKGIKSNVLVMGKTGTGKTEILKQLAQKLNRVYVVEDANEFTQEGYYGRDVSSIILDLIEAADFNVDIAEQGIVIIDEIDKKTGKQTIERDVSGAGVLNSMLKLIEGKKVEIPRIRGRDVDDDEFSTENLMIFFAGAFSDMEMVLQNVPRTQSIGFAQSQDYRETLSKTGTIKESLVKYGFPEEFVGRIDTIVQLNDLSEDVLEEIVKKSKNSIFRKYQNEFSKYGIKLQYNGKTLFKAIAKRAQKANTGARELSNIVNYMFEKILYDVFSAKKGRYHVCILQEGIEEDNTRYILK